MKSPSQRFMRSSSGWQTAATRRIGISHNFALMVSLISLKL